MRKFLLLPLVFVAGCFNPTKPSTFTCYTQPRIYCAADGSRCWEEVDFYEQFTPCPKERIR